MALSTLRRNIASQRVGVVALDTAGAAVTTGVTLRVGKDGTFANSAGTLAHKESGFWEYLPTQEETDAVHVVFLYTVPGGFPVAEKYITTQLNPHDGVRGGMTALPNVNAGAAGGLAVDTDANGAVRVVDGTGPREIDIANGVVSANVTFWQGISQVAVNGKPNVHGSELASNTITATAIAADALDDKGNWNIGKTGYALSAAGVTAIWTEAIEGVVTAANLLKRISASAAGKLSGYLPGQASTIVIRDVNDTKDRITATVDAAGNRTSTVYDDS